MVLLMPLEDERLRTCSCGHVGLCSLVRERSSFYRNGRRYGRENYESRCRECSKARAIAYQRETGAARAYAKRRRAQLREDPEALARERVAGRVYKARYRERHRELIRQRDAERRRWRRKGTEEVPKMVTSGIRLPIKPFRRWLKALIRYEEEAGGWGAEDRVARRLGTTDRVLRRYLHEQDDVDLCVVDRMTAREGSLSVWDLYPEALGGEVCDCFDPCYTEARPDCERCDGTGWVRELAEAA